MEARNGLRKVSFTKSGQTNNGLFHQWGVSNVWNKAGVDVPGHMAIVELENGEVIEVDPEGIVFVPNESIADSSRLDQFNLRKVMFKDEGSYHKAYFHAWITVPFTAENDTEFPITAGLVELENGRLSHALLDELKFVENWP